VTSEAIPARRDRFGHPPGLTVLFLTEMWEQFSYYGMRALLVYYMTRQLLIPQQQSSLIYAAYTGGAYFTPIAGGLIADRLLGRRNAVIAGGLIMAIGHFMMAFPPLFFPALATIAVGNGLYVPSIPSQINSLYAENDPRRATAYNVYYVGGNVGGVLAPIICGALGETIGWHWGFAAAGVGMVIGLTIFIFGKGLLPPEEAGLAARKREPAARMNHANLLQRYLLLGLVLLFVVVFRGAYEQVGNTVALWIEGVDRSIGGALSIPMTWFQSLNALMVIAFTPPLLWIWARQARRGKPGSSLQRMSLGALILASAYLLLAIASAMSAATGQPSHWIWAAAFFLLLTLGELYTLPVGLGLFGRLAPPQVAATVVAIWYSGISAGNLLGGVLGALYSAMPKPVFFVAVAGVAGLASLLFRLLDPFARRVEETAAADTGQLDFSRQSPHA
jgi:POT family proton-dependent oligopeptide transporter